MRHPVAVLLVVALLATLLLALSVGPYPLRLSDILNAAARLFGNADGTMTSGEIVFMRVRLPRVAAAVLVGAALAGAGTAYQTLFRNPLVSPDILGVSTGAGLGAVMGILMSLPVFGIQAFAFLGGISTVV